MPTSSISYQIVIKEKDKVQKFINALEESENHKSEDMKSCDNWKDMKIDDIEEFFN